MRSGVWLDERQKRRKGRPGGSQHAAEVVPSGGIVWRERDFVFYVSGGKKRVGYGVEGINKDPLR